MMKLFETVLFLTLINTLIPSGAVHLVQVNDGKTVIPSSVPVIKHIVEPKTSSYGFFIQFINFKMKIVIIPHKTTIVLLWGMW